MSRNLIKLKIYRKKCLPQNSKKLLDDKTNIEQIKTSSDVCKEEYLTNRNLSIMTDTQLESDVVDNVCLRQKEHINARTSNSSSSKGSQDSYILIASEEIPVILKETNWEYVDYCDITETMQSNSTTKKYCSPKCSSAWFLKIYREIMKNCSNKIHPVIVNG